MRRLSVSEIVSTYFSQWDGKPHFFVLEVYERGQAKVPSDDGFVARLLDEFEVTPREAYPILDALRLFSIDTGNDEKVQLHALIPLLIRLVRGLPLSGEELRGSGKLKLATIEVQGARGRTTKGVTLSELNARLPVYDAQIERARFQSFGHSGADNLALDIALKEFGRRMTQSGENVSSITYTYPERILGIQRLTRDLMPLEQTDHP